MNVLIIGLGNQGKKRIKYLKNDSIKTLDLYNKNADYKNFEEINSAIIKDIDFIIGGKVNTDHTYRGSFWHGCIDEIRLWNIALADSIIEYHNDYPYKLSFESENEPYAGYLGQLSGLWRFYTVDETYSTIPNDACSSIERIYNDNPCSTDSEAIIYTFGSNVEFSEKHK